MKRLFIILSLFLLFYQSFANDFINGEVIIKLKNKQNLQNNISTKSLTHILNIHEQAIETKKIFSHGNKNIFLIKSKVYSTEELIEKFKQNPNIEHVEPNIKIKPLKIPNDPVYMKDYYYYWGQDKVKAFQAWDLTVGSEDIVIAVVDTGIDYTHPDLKDNIWRNEIECSGLIGVDDDGNGYVDDCIGFDMHDQDNDPLDYDGHGTHVAGIIGAVGNNGLGIAGINWRVKLLPCKIFDDEGSGFNVLSAAIECLDYIITLKKRGVNIVASNNSWAASPGVYLGDILKEAIQEAVNTGILFITAAGNEGTNNDEVCKTDTFCQHVYPCDYKLDNDGIICVTAVDKNDELPFYANYGMYSVDLAAPGDDIYSTATTVDRFILSAVGNYGWETGTSMATPFVSGAVGLLKSMYSFLTWRDIKATILLNTDYLPSLENKVLTEGRLNIYAALNNPIRDINGTLGILIENDKIIRVEEMEGEYYPQDNYIFYEKPFSLYIYLTNNNSSIIDLIFKLLSLYENVEPAICFDNDKTCYKIDNDLFSKTSYGSLSLIKMQIEDNSEYDVDNEPGKVRVNIAFLKRDKTAEDTPVENEGGDGGCSLSKDKNDFSILLFILIMASVILVKRAKESFSNL
ncbi:MAG: S8 family serine peptidase [Aquificae bacterium]|nr:S8 family serine peptidase [Aquificota bacterium]